MTTPLIQTPAVLDVVQAVAGPSCRHVKLNGSLWETLGRAEENIHNNSISVEMRRKDPGWSPLRAAGLN